MKNMKTYRKMLKLDKDIGNPFPEEHEWLYKLINKYENIHKYSVYSLFKENTDYISLRQEFMITILKGTERYYDIKKFKDVHSSIEDIIQLWMTDPIRKNKDKWSAAYSAAESAYSGAYSAANSAYSAAARSAAESAYSGAYSAANSAYSAANSAARSAADSAANSAAYSAAESAYSGAYSAANSAYSAANLAANSAYSAANLAARSAAEKEQVQLIISLIKKYSV